MAFFNHRTSLSYLFSFIVSDPVLNYYLFLNQLKYMIKLNHRDLNIVGHILNYNKITGYQIIDKTTICILNLISLLWGKLHFYFEKSLIRFNSDVNNSITHKLAIL